MPTQQTLRLLESLHRDFFKNPGHRELAAALQMAVAEMIAPPLVTDPRPDPSPHVDEECKQDEPRIPCWRPQQGCIPDAHVQLSLQLVEGCWEPDVVDAKPQARSWLADINFLECWMMLCFRLGQEDLSGELRADSDELHTNDMHPTGELNESET